MTTTTTTNRDDLFTHIHKGLRLGLFELTTTLGRTDWADPLQLSELGDRWHGLLELLQAHSAHENDHIFRLLDPYDPIALETVADQHRDLDDLLDHLAERFDTILSAPSPTAGLGLYRDVARFVTAYLPHLHDEETRVMGRIWECCTDEEIAAARARFMADTTPAVQATSLRYLLPALDRVTRQALIAGAPPVAVHAVLAIADSVLPPAEVADLRSAIVAAN